MHRVCVCTARCFVGIDSRLCLQDAAGGSVVAEPKSDADPSCLTLRELALMSVDGLRNWHADVHGISDTIAVDGGALADHLESLLHEEMGGTSSSATTFVGRTTIGKSFIQNIILNATCIEAIEYSSLYQARLIQMQEGLTAEQPEDAEAFCKSFRRFLLEAVRGSLGSRAHASRMRFQDLGDDLRQVTLKRLEDLAGKHTEQKFPPHEVDRIRKQEQASDQEIANYNGSLSNKDYRGFALPSSLGATSTTIIEKTTAFGCIPHVHAAYMTEEEIAEMLEDPEDGDDMTEYKRQFRDAVVHGARKARGSNIDDDFLADFEDHPPRNDPDPFFLGLAARRDHFFSGKGEDLILDIVFIREVQMMLDGNEQLCAQYAKNDTDPQSSQLWETLHKHRWVLKSVTVYLPCECLRSGIRFNDAPGTGDANALAHHSLVRVLQSSRMAVIVTKTSLEQAVIGDLAVLKESGFISRLLKDPDGHKVLILQYPEMGNRLNLAQLDEKTKQNEEENVTMSKKKWEEYITMVWREDNKEVLDRCRANKTLASETKEGQNLKKAKDDLVVLTAYPATFLSLLVNNKTDEELLKKTRMQEFIGQLQSLSFKVTLAQVRQTVVMFEQQIASLTETYLDVGTAQDNDDDDDDAEQLTQDLIGLGARLEKIKPARRDRNANRKRNVSDWPSAVQHFDIVEPSRKVIEAARKRDDELRELAAEGVKNFESLLSREPRRKKKAEVLVALFGPLFDAFAGLESLEPLHEALDECHEAWLEAAHDRLWRELQQSDFYHQSSQKYKTIAERICGKFRDFLSGLVEKVKFEHSQMFNADFVDVCCLSPSHSMLRPGSKDRDNLIRQMRERYKLSVQFTSQGSSCVSAEDRAGAVDALCKAFDEVQTICFDKIRKDTFTRLHTSFCSSLDENLKRAFHETVQTLPTFSKDPDDINKFCEWLSLQKDQFERLGHVYAERSTDDTISRIGKMLTKSAAFRLSNTRINMIKEGVALCRSKIFEKGLQTKSMQMVPSGSPVWSEWKKLERRSPRRFDKPANLTLPHPQDDAMDRLTTTLEQNGLCIHPEDKDGNCLFRSLAFCFFGQDCEEGHEFVRSEVHAESMAFDPHFALWL